MGFDRINKLLSLGANLGVLVGIIFLALELRQNNDLMEAEARYNRFEAANMVPQTILDNSNVDLAAAYIQSGSEQSPEERFAFEVLITMSFVANEWTFDELPQSELPLNRWRRIHNTEKNREIWESRKSDFKADFVEFMESEVFEDRL